MLYLSALFKANVESDKPFPRLCGLREIILKARQFGFSTLILGLYFLDTVNNPNTQTIVLAQDAGSTEKLFQIVRRFQTLLPKHKQIPTRYDTKTVLYWPTIDSYFFVGTAGSRKVGRGGTINNVHGSEVAFWENMRELIAGLMEAVPEDGNIFLETTANGVGNPFYQEYWDAVEGNSVFTARFFPWFKHSEYASSTLTQGGPLIITPEEANLQETFNLTDEQLIWRRNKLLTLKSQFVQEYPSTPEEAFIATGNSFFNQETLKSMESNLEEPLEDVTFLRGFYELQRWKDKIAIFQRPLQGRSYILGVDPSEGVNTNGDHDYSPIQVLDYQTYEQVAVLHGRIEPPDLGRIANELGRWYNLALINVERNNHGHSVLNTLINECGYPLQQGNEVSGVYQYVEFDAKRTVRSKRPGWPQNQKTLAQALDALNQLVEDGTLIVKHKGTLREMRVFVKAPGYKIQAETGAHDDLVLSLALAAVLLSRSAPKATKKTGLRSSYGRYR